MRYARYALYYLPPGDADWARLATRWLGWDVIRGTAPAPPNLPGLPAALTALTARPRRYGLHATVVPPFALARGTTAGALRTLCADFCARTPPLALPGPVLTRIGSFLALRPAGDTPSPGPLAEAALRALNPARAAPGISETARRDHPRLSPRQRDTLQRWGYPHLLADYRFHITLTGSLPHPLREATETLLRHHLSPLLPAQLPIRDLALTGEDEAGRFHLIERFDLKG
jgi:uncharacterized protein DUF1045